MRVFENYESEVRGYIRAFPAIFEKAKYSKLIDEQGNEYIDFFAGAGTINYGHNNDKVSSALIDYLQNDGIVHGLDMATSAKQRFINAFQETILRPRNLEYKMQFTGPTGTNVVETALKLARLIKNRSNIVAFTNGFHGLTQGSLSISGNDYFRDESHISRCNATFMPFDNYFKDGNNTLEYFRRFLSDSSSGLDTPAAVIVETVQGEGGINVASAEWLQELEQICREYDMLLIIDDIQVGNGRTGEFFSFEEAGIYPDMVTLSKSIGGGLPLAVLLFKPELDQWKPGEHTGTFRGNNLAFVAAVETLKYWENDDLGNAVKYKEKVIKEKLEHLVQKYSELDCDMRGRGMVWGLEIGADANFASEISSKSFKNGLIIETCGSQDQVLKFLPPLLIDEKELLEGFEILDKSIEMLVNEKEEKLKKGF